MIKEIEELIKKECKCKVSSYNPTKSGFKAGYSSCERCAEISEILHQLTKTCNINATKQIRELEEKKKEYYKKIEELKKLEDEN